MDTSEQYVKMRLAAIPDMGRGGWPSREPSYPGHQSTVSIKGDDYAVWMDTKGDWYCLNDMDTLGQGLYCQLERQDQLQEMVLTRPHQYHLAFYNFGITMYTEETEEDGALCAMEAFPSMEQLWLAFVQKELHQKVWNGEGWQTC